MRSLFFGWLLVSLALCTTMMALPLFTDFTPTVVSSGSMGKKLPQGSLLIAKPGEPQVGKPILFRSEEGLVVHRVVEKSYSMEGAPFWATKGDLNGSSDLEEISEEQVVGRIAFLLPAVGFLLKSWGLLAWSLLGGLLVGILAWQRRRAPLAALLALPLAFSLAATQGIQPAAAAFTDSAAIPPVTLKELELPAPVLRCGTVTLLVAAFHWDPIPGAESYTVYYNSGKEALTVKTPYIGGLVVLGGARNIWVTANRSYGGKLYRSKPSNAKAYYGLLVGVCVDEKDPVPHPPV